MSLVCCVLKVTYSMRVSEKPLEPWILMNEYGSVSSAHCTCMAGLAEACSHIGTVLFCLEALRAYTKGGHTYRCAGLLALLFQRHAGHKVQENKEYEPAVSSKKALMPRKPGSIAFGASCGTKDSTDHTRRGKGLPKQTSSSLPRCCYTVHCK